MQDLFAIGSMLLVMLACGLGVWLPGRYALSPLRARLERRRRRWQFGLADYFGLGVLSQYALAVVGLTWRYDESLGQVAAIALGTAILALWSLGVYTLSKARIIDGRKRFVLLTVVAPIVALASVGSIMAVIVVANLVSGRLHLLSWPVLLVALEPVAIWCCRRCTEWIVRQDDDCRKLDLSSNEAESLSAVYEVSR
jgi:hypothetical protein